MPRKRKAEQDEKGQFSLKIEKEKGFCFEKKNKSVINSKGLRISKR